jgi:hypothetical protein
VRRFRSRCGSVLSLSWGLLGYHLGSAIGGFGVGPLLAVVGFAVALGVHRAGFFAITRQPQPIDPDSFSADVAAEHRVSPDAARSFHGAPQGKVIDVEYRVVS